MIKIDVEVQIIYVNFLHKDILFLFIRDLACVHINLALHIERAI